MEAEQGGTIVCPVCQKSTTWAWQVLATSRLSGKLSRGQQRQALSVLPFFFLSPEISLIMGVRIEGGGWRAGRSRADGATTIGAYVKYNILSTMKIMWALNLNKYA